MMLLVVLKFKMFHFSNFCFQFLFCESKLLPSQHSNGGDPSTTTTVEDEDEFYLSYKVIIR